MQQYFLDHRPVVQEYLESRGARLIFGLEPDYLWRLTPDQRELLEISITRYDDKTMVFGGVPNHTV